MIQEVTATQLFTRSQMLSILSANVRVTFPWLSQSLDNRVNSLGEHEVLLTFQLKQEGKGRACALFTKRYNSPQVSVVSKGTLVVTVSYYPIQYPT